MAETVNNSVCRSLHGVGISKLSLLPILVIALACGAAAAAQDPHPLEAADTSSPRATLQEFLTGMRKAYVVTSEEGRSYASAGQRGSTTKGGA